MMLLSYRFTQKEVCTMDTNQIVLNPGSERNIISICLKDNEKIIELEQQGLYPEHFSIAGHRIILMAINYLQSKEIKAEPMSIMEVLQGNTKKDVEDLGGLDYLITLQQSLVPVDNLKIFVEKVKQSYTRTLLYDIAEQTKDFVLSEQAEVLNPSELMSFVENKITDANVDTQDVEEVYKMGDNTEQVLNERAETPAEVPGLEVGWAQYDNLTNGAQPGDLIIIAAPSKTGKSVTLTNWAKKLAIIDQLPVLYFDTEMNSREQEDRILSMITGIPHSEIVSGMYVMDTIYGKADDKVQLLKKAKEMLNLGNYYHIYMPKIWAV